MQLEQKLQQEGFADLKQVQLWIAEQFGVEYGLSAVWYLARVKLQAKLKTGRARSAKQDLAAVGAFKKGSGRGGRSEGLLSGRGPLRLEELA